MIGSAYARATPSTVLLLDASEQVRWRRVEPARESKQHARCGIAPRVLQVVDVREVYTASHRQLDLRDTEPFAGGAKIRGHLGHRLGGFRHNPSGSRLAR